MLLTPYLALALRAWSEMNVYAFSRWRVMVKPADSMASRYRSCWAAPPMQDAHRSALQTMESLSCRSLMMSAIASRLEVEAVAGLLRHVPVHVLDLGLEHLRVHGGDHRLRNLPDIQRLS